MAYRIRYQLSVDWVAPGIGPMDGKFSPLSGAQGNADSGQTLNFSNAVGGQVTPGLGTNGAITAAEITTLLTGMTNDLSAQLNAAAVFNRLGLWPLGSN